MEIPKPEFRVPDPSLNFLTQLFFQHAGEIASFALDLLDSVHQFSSFRQNRPTETLKLRIGIHR